jgi:hypothetical protein
MISSVNSGYSTYAASAVQAATSTARIASKQTRSLPSGVSPPVEDKVTLTSTALAAAKAAKTAKTPQNSSDGSGPQGDSS